MAIQFSTTTEHGFDVPNAYVRISHLDAMHGKRDVMNYNIQIFKDQAAYIAGGEPFKFMTVRREYDDTTSMGFADHYAYLKTLDEFTGATDV